jgi:DNA-binding transcriptional MerR regulator
MTGRFGGGTLSVMPHRSDESLRRTETLAASDSGDRPAVGWRRGVPPRGSAARAVSLPEPYRYTLADLEQETGIAGRTIRYYISQQLLPPALGRGPTATYNLGHLVRLRAIALLKANHLPLDQIRQRLASLSDDEIAAMLEVETSPPEDTWRRIRLHPDIELFVRERPGKDRDYRFEATVETIKMIVRDQLGDEG